MNQEELFKNEEVITESGNKEIVLTNYRIRQEKSGDIASIFIKNVSSIESRYTSWTSFLIGGILVILVAILAGLNDEGQAMLAALVLGGILIGAYFLTRKHMVTISSDGGGKIYFQTQGMSTARLKGFFNKVEQAKYNFL